MSKGAVLNQKQEVDLTGYLQQSDVVNTVTQGNQSPVSSGAVYTAIQQSQSGGLNWTLLGSGNNQVSFVVPSNMNFIKFKITGSVNAQFATINFPNLRADGTKQYQYLTGSVGSISVPNINIEIIFTVQENWYTDFGDSPYLSSTFNSQNEIYEIGKVGESTTITSGTFEGTQNITISVYYL